MTVSDNIPNDTQYQAGNAEQILATITLQEMTEAKIIALAKDVVNLLDESGTRRVDLSTISTDNKQIIMVVS